MCQSGNSEQWVEATIVSTVFQQYEPVQTLNMPQFKLSHIHNDDVTQSDA